MTEHDLDDLASDLLDGQLTAEQAADALRDPAVARRVEEMRAVQALVRQVPPVDPRRREAGLAAALASALGEPAPAATPPSGPALVPGATVPDERAARRGHASGRGRGRRRAEAWLAAAAVLLVALAAGGLAVAGRGDDEQDTAASTAAESPAADDASGGAAASSQEAAPSSPAAPSSTAPGDDTASRATADAALSGTPVDLGEAGSLDELAARVAATGAEPATGTAADREGAASLEAFGGCVPDGAEQREGRQAENVAVAVLDGAPVTVWVVTDSTSDGDSDGRRMIVADASCAVVGTRDLRP
jgi:anti-sigma factor RsiW